MISPEASGQDRRQLPDRPVGFRIVTLSLQREVTVAQRVTHTVVVPCGVSEEMLLEQVLHELHDDEWRDKATVKCSEPVIIDCREAVLHHRPEHWPST